MSHRDVPLSPFVIAQKCQQALAFSSQGRHADAEALCHEVLRHAPRYFDALHLLAVIAHQQSKFDAAERLYRQALTSKPDHAQALNNHGTVLMALNRADEALARFDQSLALKPNSADALNNRGHALQTLLRLDEALISFNQALALVPGSPEVLNNCGLVLLELRRPAEALAAFDQALAAKPDRPPLLSERGKALQKLGRLEEILSSFDRALVRQPNYVEALCDRGGTLMRLRRLDDARESYTRALAIAPDFPRARLNRGMCNLMAGDLLAGWAEYEDRWNTEPFLHARKVFPQPLWLGDEDITGKTVLLHAEQGAGDTIQFCRYAPLLAARGASVVLEVPTPLKSLLSSLDGVTQLIGPDDQRPTFDLHCPLMSLPLAFKTTLGEIPAQVPYLRAAPDLVAVWRERLGARVAPRIGIVASGDPKHGEDHNRSISFRRFAPLLNANVTLVSLQKEHRPDDQQWLNENPRVQCFNDDLRDFADTAALASLMDVVISVDTSVAHLAGALGKPLWVLLSYIGVDWRWMLNGEQSPWYPTARLFRQPAIGDWDSVIARIMAEIPQIS